MTDAAGVERALVVIAVSLVLQTLLLATAVVAGWIAYRRAAETLRRELRELTLRTDEVAATVRRAADAVGRGTDAVSAAMDDARHAAESVGAWTGSLATALTTPRTAAAYGVLRGVQWWRHRRRLRSAGAV